MTPVFHHRSSGEDSVLTRLHDIGAVCHKHSFQARIMRFRALLLAPSPVFTGDSEDVPMNRQRANSGRRYPGRAFQELVENGGHLIAWKSTRRNSRIYLTMTPATFRKKKGTLSGRAEANEFDCEEDIAKPNRIDCLTSMGPGQILLMPLPSPPNP